LCQLDKMGKMNNNIIRNAVHDSTKREKTKHSTNCYKETIRVPTLELCENITYSESIKHNKA
jgi:hypothetical protein